MAFIPTKPLDISSIKIVDTQVSTPPMAEAEAARLLTGAFINYFTGSSFVEMINTLKQAPQLRPLTDVLEIYASDMSGGAYRYDFDLPSSWC